MCAETLQMNHSFAFDEFSQSKLFRLYYRQIPQCQAKDAQKQLFSVKTLAGHVLMHLVISSTDLNSAHLSALTTSAALKNGITSSTNMSFIYQPEHFVIVLQRLA